MDYPHLEGLFVLESHSAVDGFKCEFSMLENAGRPKGKIPFTSIVLRQSKDGK